MGLYGYPMSEVEEWRPVVGWEEYYEVSNLGRVRSFDSIVTECNGKRRKHAGRMISQWIGVAHGYPSVSFRRNGRKEHCLVHRLVAMAFLGAPEEGQEVCHLNGDRKDPRACNLRWDTHSNNMLDKRMHGTDRQVAKTHCPRGHALTAPNLVNRHSGRKCKACNRTRSKFTLEHPLFVEHADWQYSRIMGGVQ